MSENAQRRANVEAWLRLAEEDLRTVDYLPADADVNESRAFHCQQAAEKHLKALLVASEVEPEHIHDIGLLLRACRNAGVADVEQIMTADTLTAFAVQTRYPGMAPPVTNEEAEAARRTAQTVRDFVLAHLPFSLDD